MINIHLMVKRSYVFLDGEELELVSHILWSHLGLKSVIQEAHKYGQKHN